MTNYETWENNSMEKYEDADKQILTSLRVPNSTKIHWHVVCTSMQHYKSGRHVVKLRLEFRAIIVPIINFIIKPWVELDSVS